MTASKKELSLSLEQVQEILELRLPESVFYWLVSTNNRVKVGNRAGYVNKDGYTQIQINGKLFYTHRLVWFFTYGKFPEGVIDHIDGNPSNNKIENLRDVPHKVNMQNQKKRDRLDVNLPTGVKVGHHNKFGEIVGYHATWYAMNGKLRKVYFGIREWYTPEAALAAAITRRELEMSHLISQGAAYTERHGVD